MTRFMQIVDCTFWLLYRKLKNFAALMDISGEPAADKEKVKRLLHDCHTYPSFVISQCILYVYAVT